MTAIRGVLYLAAYLFLIVLIGRIILDWLQALARDWRPHGAVLVLAEGVYTVSDPPIKAIRRVIPPLTIGSVRLDLAVMILLFAISFALVLLAP